MAYILCLKRKNLARIHTDICLKCKNKCQNYDDFRFKSSKLMQYYEYPDGVQDGVNNEKRKI